MKMLSRTRRKNGFGGSASAPFSRSGVRSSAWLLDIWTGEENDNDNGRRKKEGGYKNDGGNSLGHGGGHSTCLRQIHTASAKPAERSDDTDAHILRGAPGRSASLLPNCDGPRTRQLSPSPTPTHPALPHPTPPPCHIWHHRRALNPLSPSSPISSTFTSTSSPSRCVVSP